MPAVVMRQSVRNTVGSLHSYEIFNKYFTPGQKNEVLRAIEQVLVGCLVKTRCARIFAARRYFVSFHQDYFNESVIHLPLTDFIIPYLGLTAPHSNRLIRELYRLHAPAFWLILNHYKAQNWFSEVAQFFFACEMRFTAFITRTLQEILDLCAPHPKLKKIATCVVSIEKTALCLTQGFYAYQGYYTDKRKSVPYVGIHASSSVMDMLIFNLSRPHFKLNTMVAYLCIGTWLCYQLLRLNSARCRERITSISCFIHKVAASDLLLWLRVLYPTYPIRYRKTEQSTLFQRGLLAQAIAREVINPADPEAFYLAFCLTDLCSLCGTRAAVLSDGLHLRESMSNMLRRQGVEQNIITLSICLKSDETDGVVRLSQKLGITLSPHQQTRDKSALILSDSACLIERTVNQSSFYGTN
jgi:c-di-GMP-related signal transduction protein